MWPWVWSRWSCDILFHKYAVHINAYLFIPHLAVGTTANSPLKVFGNKVINVPGKSTLVFRNYISSRHINCILFVIDIILYVCFLHIKNHIWEFWWTCSQAGGVSYIVKPAYVVTSISGHLSDRNKCFLSCHKTINWNIFLRHHIY